MTEHVCCLHVSASAYETQAPQARVLHLATDQARNIGRFSLGISYRF